MEKFIGLIYQPSSQYTITFIANNDVKISIDDIVYLQHDNKNQIVIYQIDKILSQYNLTNAESYFITHASKNNLETLTSTNSKPLFSLFVTCNILGIYNINDDEFSLDNESLACYTPSPLEKVYKLPTKLAISVFGLDFQEENLDLGTVIYPIKSKGFFDPKIFYEHTIVSGVTGSGKSRLVSIIIRELLRRGNHLTIFDPHNEYLELISKHVECEIFYHTRSIERYVQSFENKKIKIRDINFYENFIIPSLLGLLLPSLTEYQFETLYDVFNKKNALRKDSKQFKENPIMGLKDYIESVDELLRKTNDDSNFNYKKSNFLYESFLGLSNRLYRIQDEKIFVPKTSHINWLCENNPSLDILNLDYGSDASTRRFIHAILQCFLGNIKLNSKRILIIDEVHLLLSDKESKTYNLICRLLRESRKYNISIIFVTQNIFDIPQEVVNQFHNIISFRNQSNPELSNLDDRVCKIELYHGRANFNLCVKDTDKYN